MLSKYINLPSLADDLGISDAIFKSKHFYGFEPDTTVFST